MGYWHLYYWPLYGSATAGDSLRQRIVAAVEARFATILIANGYKTDIGANVFIWKPLPFQTSELPGMDVRDTDDTSEAQTIGEEVHTLPLEVRCAVTGDASMEDVRKIVADIKQCIGVDVTWGGLAQDTGLVQGGQGQVETAEKIVTGAVIKFGVTYTSERFNAYS